MAVAVSFGSFRLLHTQRLLLNGDQPVRLGSRALELLIALLEQQGELVTKEDLMRRVWPNIFVEPANLTVHMSALRRALDEGDGDNRFIINIPGRGYRFVAPVEVYDTVETSQHESGEHNLAYALPASVNRLIGRRETVERLAEQFDHRLITIVGPGGIGKTTVALSLAERIVRSHEYRAAFVDLERDPNFDEVQRSVAALQNCERQRERPSSDSTRPDDPGRIVLVFDNCEHAIASTAEWTIRLLRSVPNLQILATSREPASSRRRKSLSPFPIGISPRLLERHGEGCLSLSGC